VDNLEFTCDPLQMTQILINLFKNAEDAIEDKQKPGVIKVSLYTEYEKIILSVSDNGAGFPLDAITKAAEPYFTTRAKGTGLGLAIVQKIVGDHNGTLAISNVPNSGAEIKLTFTPIKLKNILT
jgi:nitrogen fixation/metabolism regulation signal transduction histidine kinase